MPGKRYGGGGFVQMDAIKEGTCRECGKTIHVGDRITWKRGYGASHFECGMAAKQKYLASKPQQTPSEKQADVEQRAAKIGIEIVRH